MADELQNLARRMHKRGCYGEYNMYGFQFEDEAGKRGWLMTVWQKDFGPVRTYWVDDGEFYITQVQFGINYSNRTLMTTFGTVPDMDPKEKVAIAKAISEWEKES